MHSEATEDKVMPDVEAAALALEEGEMVVEEEQEDQDSTPTTITVTSEQYTSMVAFLEKYGINCGELTPGEVVKKYEKVTSLASEQAQVLSRGATLDGINHILGYVSEGFVGELFHDSSTDIARAKALGWEPVKSEEANQESPTGKSDGLLRYGDLVLFQMPEEEYAARQIARDIRHSERRARRKGITQAGQQTGDPMGGPREPHPDHPIRPLSELRG